MAKIRDLIDRLRRDSRRPLVAVLDQAVYAVSNFLIQVLLARSLSMTEFGAFNFAFAVFLAISAFQQCFLIEPMLVFSSTRYKAAPCAYQRAVTSIWTGSLGALCFALFMIAAAAAAWQSFPALTQSYVAMALSGPPTLFQWQVRRLCVFHRRESAALKGGVSYACILLGGAVALRAFGQLSLIAIGALMATASVVAIATMAYRLPELTKAPTGSISLAAHLRYGRWSFASDTINWFLASGPMIILPLWSGIEIAGKLRVLTLLFMPLLQVFAAILVLMLPRFAALQESSRLKEATVRFAAITLLFATIYSAAAIAAGPAVTDLVFGANYAIGRLWIALAAIATSAFACTQIALLGLRSRERTGHVMLCHLPAAICVGSALAFAPHSGLTALLMAQAIGWLFGLLAASRFARALE